MTNEFADDLAAIANIDAVPTILDVVCRTTGMRFAAVARVTADRWIACAVRDEVALGLQPGGELQVATTICDGIRDSGLPVVIDHVAKDKAFCGHPTPKLYGFQSYISMPILRPDGRFFGTLCALDPRPARLNTPEITGMFRLFADLIGFHLDVQERLTIIETTLSDERKGGELREHFIAILGHDLRNPLASVDAGARLLHRMPLDDKAMQIVSLMQSSTRRMTELVDNMMDLARGRLGGGIAVNRVSDATLGTVLEQVTDELRAAWPDRVIERDIALDHPVACDRSRIAQLLSNLIANALTHGDPGGPVKVHARSDDDNFKLSVINQGEPIPPDTISRLFQPFSRASAQSDQQGLGLGLYIVMEIARAHGGTMEVSSLPEETRFTFRMRCREIEELS